MRAATSTHLAQFNSFGIRVAGRLFNRVAQLSWPPRCAPAPGCSATSRSSSCLASSCSRPVPGACGSASARPCRAPSPAAGCGTAHRTGVAHFLHQVGGAAVAHERRAGVAADDRTRERRRNEHRLRAGLGQVHAFVVAAEHHQRRVFMQALAHVVVVRLDARRNAIPRSCRACPCPLRGNGGCRGRRFRWPPRRSWRCRRNPG